MFHCGFHCAHSVDSLLLAFIYEEICAEIVTRTWYCLLYYVHAGTIIVQLFNIRGSVILCAYADKYLALDVWFQRHRPLQNEVKDLLLKTVVSITSYVRGLHFDYRKDAVINFITLYL